MIQHASGNVNSALAYAQRGIPIIPVKPGFLAPMQGYTIEDATTDPDLIRKMFDDHPRAAPGTVLGKAVWTGNYGHRRLCQAAT